MTNVINFLKETNRFLVGAALATVALVLVSLPSTTHAQTLSRQLDVGMSGGDVSALQTFLAQDKTIYPQGLVTGYFGFLTKSAVSNFQSRNGIDSVGRVGPITLAALNLQMPNGMSNNSAAPVISSVGISASRNAAMVNWNTSELSKGVVYYSTSPLVTYERENSVDVSGSVAMTDSNFRASQSVSLQGLQTLTTYYYMIYTTDQSGNVTVTWPSTFVTTN